LPKSDGPEGPALFTAIEHWDLGVRWSLGFGAWDLTL
jgi:hypothetical protein